MPRLIRGDEIHQQFMRALANIVQARGGSNSDAVAHDRMSAMLARTCTECVRRANLRRHSYLAPREVFFYECNHFGAGKDLPVLRS